MYEGWVLLIERQYSELWAKRESVRNKRNNKLLFKVHGTSYMKREGLLFEKQLSSLWDSSDEQKITRLSNGIRVNRCQFLH